MLLAGWRDLGPLAGLWPPPHVLGGLYQLIALSLGGLALIFMLLGTAGVLVIRRPPVAKADSA